MCGGVDPWFPIISKVDFRALSSPPSGPLLERLLCSVGRRYVTRPSSDDEDDGDEKGEEEEGERIHKDEGLYMDPQG